MRIIPCSSGSFHPPTLSLDGELMALHRFRDQVALLAISGNNKDSKMVGATAKAVDELIGVWIGRLEEKLRLSLEKQARAMRGDDTEVQRTEAAPSE